MRRIDVVVKKNFTLLVLIKDSYGTYHAVIRRERTQDYVFCWNYDSTDGTWGQGHYCTNYTGVMKALTESLGPLSNLRVVDGINVKVH